MLGLQASVLIVDGHPIAREGLKSLIKADRGFVLCNETGSSTEASRFVEEYRPHGVIIDPHAVEGDGFSLIYRLAGRDPTLRILVCSVRDDAVFERRAFIAGAHGFICKAESSDRILEALAQVMAGNLFVSFPVWSPPG